MINNQTSLWSPSEEYKKKSKLFEFCQLLNEKNIYIIDGSIFDFKTNKYPLGIVIANARRMGRLLSK